MHYFDSSTTPGLEPRTVHLEIRMVAPIQWKIEATIRGTQDPTNSLSGHYFISNNML